MKQVTKTATQARQEFFDLLNAAKYGGQITTITKNSKVIAKIIPVDEPKVDWDTYIKELPSLKIKFTKEDLKSMKSFRDSFDAKRFQDW